MLTKDERQVEEAFRRMAFNVFAYNRDDVKNFYYLVRRDGLWHLATALAWALQLAAGSETEGAGAPEIRVMYVGWPAEQADKPGPGGGDDPSRTGAPGEARGVVPGRCGVLRRADRGAVGQQPTEGGNAALGREKQHQPARHGHPRAKRLTTGGLGRGNAIRPVRRSEFVEEEDGRPARMRRFSRFRLT